VRLSDVGAHALGNLMRHKSRTILTLCGVGVGVATLTVMVSLGEGVKRLIEGQVDKAELITRITVLPKGATGQLPIFRRPGRGPQQDGDDEAGPKLDDAVVESLSKLPGVVTVYPDMHTPFLGAELDGKVMQAESEGLPAKAISENYERALVAGRYWTEADAQAQVAVAPSRVLEDLGISPQAAVGQRVYFMRIDQLSRYEMQPEDPAAVPPSTTDGPVADGATTEPRPPLRVRYVRPPDAKLIEVEIIGVYESEEFGMAGRRFQVPLALGRRLLTESGLERALGGRASAGRYRALTVKVEGRTDVAPVRELIEAKGFDTLAIADLLKFVGILFAVIEVLLAFFGGIGLVVSFFGIANTMVMAVLERTREIGVLKALGARDRDVRRVFLAEAATIGLTGGGLGVLFGLGTGKALNAIASYVMSQALNGRPIEVFYVPLWLAGAAMGVAMLVATVAGLYPAWRAARLDPVVALRME
jgi:putative ABC transport system permease protein